MSTQFSDAKSANSSTRPEPRKRRGNVGHLFWVGDMEFAETLQIDMRALCGVWVAPRSVLLSLEERNTVDVIGGIFPVAQRRDCLRCLRVLEAHYRRAFVERLRREGGES